LSGRTAGEVQPGRVGISPEGGSWTESEGRAVVERHGKPLVSGLVLAPHLVHGGLDGDEVHADRSVIDHIGGRHRRGLVVRHGAGEGIFGWSGFGGGGVR